MDDRSDRLILIGGLTANGASGELWIGGLDDGNVDWSGFDQGVTYPSARSSHDATLSGGAVYVFGGTGVEGFTSDLWRLKLPDAN